MFKNVIKISSRMYSSLPAYSYENIKVTNPSEFVYQVEINNPTMKNALKANMWSDIKTCFNKINEDPDCRSVILTGAENTFCSGIDLSMFANFMGDINTNDPGRRAFLLYKFIKPLQDSFLSIQNCLKPVIGAVNGPCIGAGLNMLCYTDIRIASENSWFQLKEAAIGIAADLGAIQLLPILISNQSFVSQIIFEARKFTAKEAAQYQLISEPIYPDNAALLDSGLKIATQIAQISPVAVQSAKAALIYSRNNPSVKDGLAMQRMWNMSALQSEDLLQALTASMNKTKPTFAKL